MNVFVRKQLFAIAQEKGKLLKSFDNNDKIHLPEKLTFVFYPNIGLLGDKILYEPIVRSLLSTSSKVSIIGIEWDCDPISMMQFPSAPNATIVLPPFFPQNKLYFKRFFRWLDYCNEKYSANLITYYDHSSNEQFTNGSLSKALKLNSLWDELTELSKNRRFPELNIPVQTENDVESKLRDFSFNVKDKYVTIHIRSLEADSKKNLDFKKYLNLGKEIVKNLGVQVVFLGRNDTFSNKQKSTCMHELKGIFDFRDEFKSVWETAYLLKNAIAHIGGDSGPTHLAAALGTSIVTVERSHENPDNDYGPFTGNKNVIRLTKKKSSINNIVSSLRSLTSIPKVENTKSVDLIDPKSSNRVLESNASSIISENNMRSIPQEDTEIQNEFNVVMSISNEGIDVRTSLEYNRMCEDQIPNALYIPLRGSELREFISVLKAIPPRGFFLFNVFKKDILSYVDEMDVYSCLTGSADTVINRKGKWIAYNFSIPASLELIYSSTELRGKSVIIYGDNVEALLLGHELLNKGYDVINTYGQKNFQSQDADIFLNTTVLSSNDHSPHDHFKTLIPHSISLIVDIHEDLHNSPLKQIARSRSCKYIGRKEILKKRAIFQVCAVASEGGQSHVA